MFANSRFLICSCSCYRLYLRYQQQKAGTQVIITPTEMPITIIAVRAAGVRSK